MQQFGGLLRIYEKSQQFLGGIENFKTNTVNDMIFTTTGGNNELITNPTLSADNDTLCSSSPSAYKPCKADKAR